MIPDKLILIFAGTSVINVLVLTYLSFKNKIYKNQYSNILTILFLVLSVTFVANFLPLITENSFLFFDNIIKAGMFAIGPLTFLYTLLFLKFYSKLSKLYLLHFAPSIFILIFDENLLREVTCGSKNIVILFQLGLYIILTAFAIYKAFRKYLLNNNEKKWIIGIASSMLLFWLGYFLFFIGFTQCISAMAFFASGAYWLIILIMSGISIQKQSKGEKKSTIIKDQTEQTKDIITSLINLLENEKIYLESDITLEKLAKKLSVNRNILSHAINSNFNKNFNKLLNYYRVEEVKKLLNNPKYTNTKISFIAYECGFNTLSSFYTAFKEQTGLLPADYRENLLKS